jgi:hypothetical protein
VSGNEYTTSGAAARSANEACYQPDGQKAPDGAALAAAHLSTYAAHTLETFTNPPDRARPGFGGYAPEAFAKQEDFAALACIYLVNAIAGGWSTLVEWEAAAGGEYQRQAGLLRDIFGNLFRSVVFAPVWRTDTAVALARQMYEARDFSAMPILADALQDAGCDNEDILTHCRDTNQVHVRGCWVCDLVLGKE